MRDAWNEAVRWFSEYYLTNMGDDSGYLKELKKDKKHFTKDWDIGDKV